jgi:hypothetical protein
VKMAKLTVSPSLAKWGFSANDMASIGGAGDPTSLYGLAFQFKKTDTGPVTAPFIPPQGLIQPGKDEVDVDFYVVWSNLGLGGGLATQKVGWVVSIAEAVEGGSVMDAISPGPVGTTPTIYKDNAGEVDWGWTPPDSYQVYPYLQFGLAYDLSGLDWILHRTKVASFKMVNGALAVDPSRRSFGKISGTVGGKQVFGGLYIWRAQGGQPGVTSPTIFGGGVFDADGDGQKDTDNFDDDVVLWGVIAEFK